MAFQIQIVLTVEEHYLLYAQKFLILLNDQSPVLKRIVFAEQEIPQKQFEKLGGFMDAFFQIVVVCANHRISKIPSVLRKNVVGHIKAEKLQIFDEKHRHRAPVSICLCKSNSISIFPQSV